MIKYKNDSERLAQELQELQHKNVELYELLVNDLAPWVSTMFGKDLVITMIYRTDSEQDEIYGGKTKSDGREYDVKPWKSPHQFYHSVDLRSNSFTISEVKTIESYLAMKYNSSNYYGFTAKNHNVGLGDHFHLQFVIG